MRILHLSDVHIGVENYGRPATLDDISNLPDYFAPGIDREEYVGSSTRMIDFLCTLDAAVSYAINNRVDFVVFSGDAYKNRDPSQTHQREFARRINRVANANIPVFLTVGNHDLPHVSNRATALEIFPTLSVSNVFVGSTLKTHLIKTNAGPIQVIALPWIRLGSFMAKEETREMSLDQITKSVEDRLTTLLNEEIKNLDPSIPAILSGHVTVAGAKVSSERGLMLGNDHVLSLGTLANASLDYVALGHVHKHQILAKHPYVVYPGSLQRIDFSEENDSKGFCVFELNTESEQGKRLENFNFIEVDARSMLTLDIKVPPGEDPTEVTKVMISKSFDKVADSIVRLRVNMESSDEHAFREIEIRNLLKRAHYIASIEKNVRRERRTRLATEESEKLTPMEAMKRYFSSRNVPEKREEELLERAGDLLREEIEQ